MTTALQDPEEYIPVRKARSDERQPLRSDRPGREHAASGHPAGDTVIVRRQPVAKPGDIVVALVGEEATVKRYREKQGRIELHPENDLFQPIIPREDGEPFSLLGRVIEVRRRIE